MPLNQATSFLYNSTESGLSHATEQFDSNLNTVSIKLK